MLTDLHHFDDEHARKAQQQRWLLATGRWLLIYGLLLGGSIIFSLPFAWMIGTSFKVDREMFGEQITFLPMRPVPAAASPYLDEHYFPKTARQVVRGRPPGDRRSAGCPGPRPPRDHRPPRSRGPDPDPWHLSTPPASPARRHLESAGSGTRTGHPPAHHTGAGAGNGAQGVPAPELRRRARAQLRPAGGGCHGGRIPVFLLDHRRKCRRQAGGRHRGQDAHRGPGLSIPGARRRNPPDPNHHPALPGGPAAPPATVHAAGRLLASGGVPGREAGQAAPGQTP
jgi:hypothetical protein